MHVGNTEISLTTALSNGNFIRKQVKNQNS